MNSKLKLSFESIFLFDYCSILTGVLRQKGVYDKTKQITSFKAFEESYPQNEELKKTISSQLTTLKPRIYFLNLLKGIYDCLEEKIEFNVTKPDSAINEVVNSQLVLIDLPISVSEDKGNLHLSLNNQDSLSISVVEEEQMTKLKANLASELLKLTGKDVLPFISGKSLKRARKERKPYVFL